MERGRNAIANRSKRSWHAISAARRAFETDEFDYRLGLLSVGDFQVAYRKGTADERVLKSSFENDIFLAGVPEYEPDSDDLVIDVGAHIGTFTTLIAPRVRRVYAVEASEEACNYLRVNCLINRLENVEAFHLALGGTTGMVELSHARENWSHSITTKASRHSETVPMSTLHDFMREQAITHCDFLKMNCEGAEFPILLAASLETLRTIDLMVVLYHCDLALGLTPEELTSHLSAAGFGVEIRNRTPQRGWLIATLER